MSTGPSSQFTIAHGMAAVAGVAAVLGVALTPGLAPILGMILIPSMIVGVIACLACLAGRRLIELCYGHRCPGCHGRRMEFRAVVSFGDRFFLCPHCGLRCRRSLLLPRGLFRWRDASGPEYDALFARPPEEDPWNAPPDLVDEEFVYSKTHLNLVRNKRRRRPENPNGPGLE